jgi:plastocyanin
VQRGLVIVGCAAVGALAIVFAVMALTKSPDVVPVDNPNDRAGALRTSVVRILDGRFPDRNVSLRAGQTVRWVNADDEPHSVVRTSGPEATRFDSGELQPDEEFERAFVDKGVFEYTLEPDGRSGKVTVLGD